jgi:peroxisomal 2,4-dienoyl-CoA reductase
LFSDAGNFVNGNVLVVDGASWRTPMSGLGPEMSYPRNVLSGEVPKGVKSGRRTKL